MTVSWHFMTVSCHDTYCHDIKPTQYSLRFHSLPPCCYITAVTAGIEGDPAAARVLGLFVHRARQADACDQRGSYLSSAFKTQSDQTACSGIVNTNGSTYIDPLEKHLTRTIHPPYIPFAEAMNKTDDIQDHKIRSTETNGHQRRTFALDYYMHACSL